MRHVNLAQAFARLVKERKIWVYDIEVLLNSQPITTYGDATLPEAKKQRWKLLYTQELV